MNKSSGTSEERNPVHATVISVMKFSCFCLEQGGESGKM